MITVHHLADSRSQRVLWLLEELAVEYQVERYERDPATGLAPASLKRVHPLGKSPVITDQSRTVAETGHIVEYLVHEHGAGRLAPAAGTEAYLRYRYWLHYAEGSLMTPLLLRLVFDAVGARAPWVARPFAKALCNRVQRDFVQPQLRLHFDYLENELRSQSWFAGDQFSAADIVLSFPIEAAVTRLGLGERCPQLRRFVDTVQARPAYQRALQRGGPYAYAAS